MIYKKLKFRVSNIVFIAGALSLTPVLAKEKPYCEISMTVNPYVCHNGIQPKVKKMLARQQFNERNFDVIPMSKEKRQYLLDISKAIISYLIDEIALEEAEKTIGKGENSYPKNPQKPITDRLYSKMHDRDFTMYMRRKDEKSKWNYIEVGFEPRGYLYTYYGLNLKKTYFNGLTFEKAETFEDSQYALGSRKKNRFSYRYRSRGIELRIVFIADMVYSSIKDGYPKNFSEIQFFRIN